MPSSMIRFRLDDASSVAENLAARGGGEGEGLVARLDLARYYSLIADARGSLRFDRRELSLICDANNAAATTASVIPGASTGSVGMTQTMFWANVADAIEQNAMHRKWDLSDVEAHALVERLRGLSRIEAVALVDAVERFWATDHAQDIADFFAALDFGVRGVAQR